jgi:hypothetical protein
MNISLNSVWELLATAGITSAAVSAFILWISKEWLTEKLRARIKSEYDEKLETHKAQLKAHGDVETERLKSQLSVAAAERQFQFANLHEKRGEVIAATYSALQIMFAALAEYTKMIEIGGGPSREERGKLFAEAGNKFLDLFTTTKIYLPRDTAIQVEKIFQEIRGAHIDFMFAVDANHTPDIKVWQEVHHKVQALSKVAIADLEDDLRGLLGDTVPSKASGGVVASSAEPDH